MHEAIILKTVKRENVYYTLNWSRLMEADKYSVNKGTPAMAGIIELYFLDEYKKLRILRREHVWYGGVRSRLREAVDPTLELKDKPLQKLLEKSKLFCRYTLSESIPDMSDIIFFLPNAPVRPGGETDHSGRYKKIFVNEVNAEKIVTVD